MADHATFDGGRDHWFEGLADHLGAAYLRYSFTYGTEQEVDFLVDVLGLRPGMRVLDVGCGPGRHAHALARRGIAVHGIDISERFVAIATANAPAGATFARADARTLDLHDAFDAAISLCQGAFGLAGLPGAPLDEDPDGVILQAIARALVPGGVVAVSAFSAYFQVRHLGEAFAESSAAADDPPAPLPPGVAHFDADAGVNHERTEIRSEEGEVAEVDLWTSCFTPRELRLLARRAGLAPEAVWAVRPGEYARRVPDVDHEEFLLVARRPFR